MCRLVWKLTIALTLIFSCVHGCPLSDLLNPCECIDAYGQVFVECNGVTDYQELMRSLQSMAGFDITRLNIKKSKFKHIPSDSFLNVTISKIVVSESSLFDLFDTRLPDDVAFTLVELQLQNVQFDGGLDWTTLENAENLEQLKMSQTNLEQLTESFTRITLPNLETVQMDDDVIKDICDQAFTMIPKLKNLILKNNLLTKFERKMLPHPTEMQFLDLRGNLLESFSEDMFDGMPKLTSLLLDNNRFITLHKSYMEKVFKQLFFFSVAGNPLKCSCELSWLLASGRPFHLFGRCTEHNTQSEKELKLLGMVDFDTCVL